MVKKQSSPQDRRIGVNLDEAVHEALLQLAEDREQTISAVARQAITEMVEREVWASTIGRDVVPLLKQGLDAKAIIKKMHQLHPGSRISEKTVAWYRSKARKEDPSILSEVQAKAKA